ncbi:MAG: hypothetical protein KA538_00200 [Azonexus sp.]|jgi:hypothetical protein|nr:hypothetical protein [Azonexus sp.]
MTPANIICIKWGTKYPAYYVNRLYAGVQRHLSRPFRFFCVTDDASGIRPEVEIIPLPVEPFAAQIATTLAESKRKGAFGKISLFKPGLIDASGPILGFDLDVVITGPLDELIDFAPGKICMRHDWLGARRGRPDGHGSVFRYDPGQHGYLYNDFATDPAGSIRNHKFSEQKYTSSVAQKHGDFEYFPGKWIASFKRDAMRFPPLNFLLEPHLPATARVMCFHGNPKMEEAVEGFKAGFSRHTRPCTWLREQWAESDAGVSR